MKCPKILSKMRKKCPKINRPNFLQVMSFLRQGTDPRRSMLLFCLVNSNLRSGVFVCLFFFFFLRRVGYVGERGHDRSLGQLRLWTSLILRQSRVACTLGNPGLQRQRGGGREGNGSEKNEERIQSRSQIPSRLPPR